MSVNQVTLVGRLGGAPELRQIESGSYVANFNLATSRTYKPKGEAKSVEHTEWHRVVVWGEQGVNCHRHIGKGCLVSITGRLQTDEWTDDDGAKHWSTKVIAQDVQFLTMGPDKRAEQERNASAQTQ